MVQAKKNFKYALIALFASFMCVSCGLAFSSCENATEINAANITEITAAASDNYGIRVSFLDDKRIEDKGVDIYVKCDKKIDNVIVWEEGQEKQSIVFAEKDKWYSMTFLLAMAANKPNTEQFDKFGEALTQTYIFNSTERIKLTFRVVVGDVEPNVQGTGEVLTGSMNISKEFVLKVN